MCKRHSDWALLQVRAFCKDPVAVEQIKEKQFEALVQSEAQEEGRQQHGPDAAVWPRGKILHCSRCAPSQELYSIRGLREHLRAKHRRPSNRHLLQPLDC